jgi:hypothetical protein
MAHPYQIELQSLSVGKKFYQLNKSGTPKYNGADCVVYYIESHFIQFINLKTNKLHTISKKDIRFVVLID